MINCIGWIEQDMTLKIEMPARTFLNPMEKRFFSDAIEIDEFELIKLELIRVISKVYNHSKDQITIALKTNEINVCVLKFYIENEEQKFLLEVLMKNKTHLITRLNDELRESKTLENYRVSKISEPKYTGRVHIYLVFQNFNPCCIYICKCDCYKSSILKYFYYLASDTRCFTDLECADPKLGDCFYCLSAGICRKFEPDKFDCIDTDTGCGTGDACKEGICRPGYNCVSNNTSNTSFIAIHYLLLSCDGSRITGVCVKGKRTT